MTLITSTAFHHDAPAETLPRLATPPDDRPHLTARPVISMPDVLLMGHIRHECRAGFSHDTTPIDDKRQEAWWRANHARVEAYLFDDGAGVTVGYGALLQQFDGRWVSSVAVLPGCGGRGYGKAITTWLVAVSCEHEVWARARQDNPAAQKLHDPLVWDTIGADEANVYYRTKPKIRRASMAINLDHAGWLGQ